jgi:hypothetical protein
MHRTCLLCGAAGAAVALLLAGMVAANARQAGSPPVVPGQATAPGSAMPLVPDTASLFTPPPQPAVSATPPARQERLKEKGIDDLVTALEQIKARKAELDKAEKETTALLKEKLRQQRQKLQQLGVFEEVEHPVPPPVVPGPAAPLPASSTGPSSGAN